MTIGVGGGGGGGGSDYSEYNRSFNNCMWLCTVTFAIWESLVPKPLAHK